MTVMIRAKVRSEHVADQENLKGWLAELSIPQQLTLAGEYRSF